LCSLKLHTLIFFFKDIHFHCVLWSCAVTFTTPCVSVSCHSVQCHVSCTIVSMKQIEKRSTLMFMLLHYLQIAFYNNQHFWICHTSFIIAMWKLFLAWQSLQSFSWKLINDFSFFNLKMSFWSQFSFRAWLTLASTFLVCCVKLQCNHFASTVLVCCMELECKVLFLWHRSRSSLKELLLLKLIMISELENMHSFVCTNFMVQFVNLFRQTFLVIWTASRF